MNLLRIRTFVTQLDLPTDDSLMLMAVIEHHAHRGTTTPAPCGGREKTTRSESNL